MNPLTAAEFITTLAGAQITLMPEPPKDLVPEGTIVVWPSCTADYEDPPGRHIEALVFSGMHGGYVMIMVSKRVFAALGGKHETHPAKTMGPPGCTGSGYYAGPVWPRGGSG